MKDLESILPSDNEIEDLFATSSRNVNEIYTSFHQVEAAKLIVKLIRERVER
jgi:hypothetical protein